MELNHTCIETLTHEGEQEEGGEETPRGARMRVRARAGFRRNDNYSGWHYVVINLEAD